MKEKVLELVKKLLADIEALEEDSSADLDAAKARIAELEQQVFDLNASLAQKSEALNVDEAKIEKAKEDLA